MAPAVRDKVSKKPANHVQKPAIWQDGMVEVKETFRRIAQVKHSGFTVWSDRYSNIRSGPTLSRNRMARVQRQAPLRAFNLPPSTLREIENNRSQPPFVSFNHLQNLRGMCRRINAQSSLTERRKNPHDPSLYPVFIRRPVYPEWAQAHQHRPSSVSGSRRPSTPRSHADTRPLTPNSTTARGPPGTPNSVSGGRPSTPPFSARKRSKTSARQLMFLDDLPFAYAPPRFTLLLDISNRRAVLGPPPPFTTRPASASATPRPGSSRSQKGSGGAATSSCGACGTCADCLRLKAPADAQPPVPPAYPQQQQQQQQQARSASPNLTTSTPTKAQPPPVANNKKLPPPHVPSLKKVPAPLSSAKSPPKLSSDRTYDRSSQQSSTSQWSYVPFAAAYFERRPLSVGESQADQRPPSRCTKRQVKAKNNAPPLSTNCSTTAASADCLSSVPSVPDSSRSSSMLNPEGRTSPIGTSSSSTTEDEDDDEETISTHSDSPHSHRGTPRSELSSPRRQKGLPERQPPCKEPKPGVKPDSATTASSSGSSSSSNSSTSDQQSMTQDDDKASAGSFTPRSKQTTSPRGKRAESAPIKAVMGRVEKEKTAKGSSSGPTEMKTTASTIIVQVKTPREARRSIEAVRKSSLSSATTDQQAKSATDEQAEALHPEEPSPGRQKLVTFAATASCSSVSDCHNEAHMLAGQERGMAEPRRELELDAFKDGLENQQMAGRRDEKEELVGVLRGCTLDTFNSGRPSQDQLQKQETFKSRRCHEEDDAYTKASSSDQESTRTAFIQSCSESLDSATSEDDDDDDEDDDDEDDGDDDEYARNMYGQIEQGTSSSPPAPQVEESLEGRYRLQQGQGHQQQKGSVISEQASHVAVKYSADAYVDFKNSMWKIIKEENLDEDQLEELFQSYLDLNSPVYHSLLRHVISDVKSELMMKNQVVVASAAVVAVGATASSTSNQPN